jgi:hypothetical protein
MNLRRHDGDSAKPEFIFDMMAINEKLSEPSTLNLARMYNREHVYKFGENCWSHGNSCIMAMLRKFQVVSVKYKSFGTCGWGNCA